MEEGEQAYRKRCKRWDIDGDAHCLAFSCLWRQPFFRSDRTCQRFLDSLAEARGKLGFHLWAWVIMPEHVHLVIWPRGNSMSAILSAVKQPVSRKAVRWLRAADPAQLAKLADGSLGGRIIHRFWLHGGGYDRNLRSDHDIHEKIRYVHENPMRRGLVTDPANWAWSSYRAHHCRSDEPIPLDLDSLPVLLT